MRFFERKKAKTESKSKEKEAPEKKKKAKKKGFQHKSATRLQRDIDGLFKSIELLQKELKSWQKKREKNIRFLNKDRHFIDVVRKAEFQIELARRKEKEIYEQLTVKRNKLNKLLAERQRRKDKGAWKPTHKRTQKASSRICPYCGKKGLSPRAPICPNCGEPFE